MMDYRPRYYTDSSTRWLFSYSDMMTILLVLFVAISAHSLHKVQARPRPTPPPAPVPELVRVQRTLEARGLSPKLEARGLVVSLPQAVLFSSGDDQVSAAALPMLEQVAESIRGIPNHVTLAGHADDIPIHNKRFRDNWMLSVARGLSLLEVLSQRYGIPETRLSVAGFGSGSPRTPNDNPENRALNRRVEIVILPK